MLPDNTSFICRSCGAEKSTILEKQKFLAEKAYESLPLFCDACINARLNQIWETPGERRVATCTECGCETKLNFVPNKELPVFCPECYKKTASDD